MTEDEAEKIASTACETLSRIFSRELKITIICRHHNQKVHGLSDRHIIASDDNNYDVQELLRGLNGEFK